MSKMKRFLAGLTVAAALAVPFQALASGEGSGITPDAALKKLMDGNARFMKDDKEYMITFRTSFTNFIFRTSFTFVL